VPRQHVLEQRGAGPRLANQKDEVFARLIQSLLRMDF
jgi:hypothetical protein